MAVILDKFQTELLADKIAVIPAAMGQLVRHRLEHDQTRLPGRIALAPTLDGELEADPEVGRPIQTHAR